MDSWGVHCLFIQVKCAHRMCLALRHAGRAAWYFLGAARGARRCPALPVSPVFTPGAAEGLWKRSGEQASRRLFRQDILVSFLLF